MVLPVSPRRSVASALAVGTAALSLGVLVGTAQAEVVGQLAVEPLGGSDLMGNIRIISSADCPAPSTHFVIRAEGGGFPPNSNAVGHNEIAGFDPGASGKGLVVPLHATWDDVAKTNGAKKHLDGTVQLTLVCLDIEGQDYGEMTGTVSFDRSGSSSTFEQVGGPRLSSGIPLTPEDAARAERGEPFGVAADADSDAAAGPGSTGAGDATAAASDVRSEQSEGDTATVAGPGRSDSPSRMPLLVGVVALAVAAGAGGLLFRAARTSPNPGHVP